MIIDLDGLNFIKRYEGFSAKPYKDIVGVWTVGYGHKILPHEDFRMGITEPQAEGILFKDVEGVEQKALDVFPACNQNQLNALCSFGFNLGVGALETMMAHGIDQIPSQMLRWDNAGHKEILGLKRRREAEASLFLEPVRART